jgi:hypothetical protein
MQLREFDLRAKALAGTFSECLYLPIAARDEGMISRYIGDIMRVLTRANQPKALLVRAHKSPPRDIRVPVWQLPESVILDASLQVWVDIDLDPYRKAYRAAFGEADLSSQVLDHVLNRRVAKLKGFRYVRLVPISRAANSSSGALSEKWSVDYHSSPGMRKINSECRTCVQYADVADLVKMLDMKTGNSLQDGVNSALNLFEAQLP